MLAFSLVHFGQPQTQNVAGPGSIFAGEKLIYEGKVSKLRLSFSIAELTFSASTKAESNELLINAEGVSKGTMLKLFKFSFLQQYESTIDLANFNVLKTTKHDVQKQRVRDSEATFDYKEKRVSYTETDPKDSNRPPRRIASEIGDHMNDMISAIYAVRLQSLTVGKRFDLEVSDSGLVFKVPVVVTAREQQKTVTGKVWCLRVEPEIFGKDRLIERKGKMVIWMTDDVRHTPVRATVDTEYGKVEIKLKSVINPA
jgi:hypothetical protein